MANDKSPGLLAQAICHFSFVISHWSLNDAENAESLETRLAQNPRWLSRRVPDSRPLPAPGSLLRGRSCRGAAPRKPASGSHCLQNREVSHRQRSALHLPGRADTARNRKASDRASLAHALSKRAGARISDRAAGRRNTSGLAVPNRPLPWFPPRTLPEISDPDRPVRTISTRHVSRAADRT